MAKKTYKEKGNLYRDDEWRMRAEMCAREQALIHVQEDAPHKADIKALAMGVIAGMTMDIEALLASAINMPSAEASITDDAALLDAINLAWPVVAGARYPGAVELMNQIALSRTHPLPQARTSTTVIPPTIPMPPVPPPLPQTGSENP